MKEIIFICFCFWPAIMEILNMKKTIYIWVIPPNHSENMLALVKIAVLLSLPSFILQIKLSKKSEFNLQGKNWQRLQNCNFHQCQHIFAVAGWNHPYVSLHMYIGH